MEKIVSDDANIADELNLPKPEDVAGVEARDEEKKEDIAIEEEAKEEISIPVEDKGLHDTTGVLDTPQPAEDSEASIAEDPVETAKEIARESFGIGSSTLLENVEHIELPSGSNANDTEDPVGTSEELGLSERVTEEEQTVQESIKDVSAVPSSTLETDEKTPEPLSESIARELADATVDTHGIKPSVEAPKEPAISETVAEEVKGVVESSEVSGADSSNIVEHDNPVEPVSESIAQEPSEPTSVEEKPADDEVSTNAVDVSPQIPKKELPLNGASDVVPSEPEEVKIETLVAEKNVEDHNADADAKIISEPEDKTIIVSSDYTSTSEVAEQVTKPEIDAKKENPEKNLGIKMTTSTETMQSIAEGVEVSKDAKDENLEVQNSNLVELSRDIKMVEAECNVPIDDKQCESKELETELKPNKQTLLDKFENENTEDKEQETIQVGAGSLTETKADEEVTKTELSGKKPKTIISKVKQSIVKVKKALIGKSPSSKTMAPEGIDETKAK